MEEAWIVCDDACRTYGSLHGKLNTLLAQNGGSNNNCSTPLATERQSTMGGADGVLGSHDCGAGTSRECPLLGLEYSASREVQRDRRRPMQSLRFTDDGQC